MMATRRSAKAATEEAMKAAVETTPPMEEDNPQSGVEGLPEPPIPGLVWVQVGDDEGKWIDPRDRILQSYEKYKLPQKTHHGAQDAVLRVQNIPADRTISWATDPRLDGGRHVEMMRELGFRPVELDEVTTDPFAVPEHEGKLLLHVTQWVEGPNRMVLRAGGALLVGYRQYRDQRRAMRNHEFRRELDAVDSKSDNLGVEQEMVSRVAGLEAS